MEEIQIMESFTFCSLDGAKEHHFRVTAHENQYAVERDGVFVAELKCLDNKWQQVSGDDIGDTLVKQTGEQIEAHFC